jgi:hypothetical protein
MYPKRSSAISSRRRYSIAAITLDARKTWCRPLRKFAILTALLLGASIIGPAAGCGRTPVDSNSTRYQHNVFLQYEAIRTLREKFEEDRKLASDRVRGESFSNLVAEIRRIINEMDGEPSASDLTEIIGTPRIAYRLPGDSLVFAYMFREPKQNTRAAIIEVTPRQTIRKIELYRLKEAIKHYPTFGKMAPTEADRQE